MNLLDVQGRDSPDRFLLAPLAYVAALGFVSIVAIDILSVLAGNEVRPTFDARFLDLLALGAMFIVLFYLLRYSLSNAIERKYKKFFSFSLATIFLIVLLATLRTALFEWQALKLNVFSSKYHTCSKNARQYDEGKAFRVCSIRIDGNAYAVVVYDSGGEIARPREQQTKSFREFLLHYEKPMVFECDQLVRQIKSSWYYLEANCG